MSELNRYTWTKQTLAEAINMRVDRNELSGSEYVMPLDISDQALEEFQTVWEENSSVPLTREHEFGRVYQAITAGW